jgi:NAD+ diphosphatase
MFELFNYSVEPLSSIDTSSVWLVFIGENLLLFQENNQEPLKLLNAENIKEFSFLRQHYLGNQKNIHYYAAEINADTLVSPNFVPTPLRAVFPHLGENLLGIASTAKQILYWDRMNQFCSFCANPLVSSNKERFKHCVSCNRMIYPQISPVAIVLITRGKELLLARSPHFLPGMYSALAGFLEAGETVEHAIHREVYEEVRLKVKNFQYYTSQSWPFPHSLMLGFYAEYDSGEILPDPTEIEDAKWFTIDNLPQLPSQGSIGRRLIENYIKKS